MSTFWNNNPAIREGSARKFVLTNKFFSTKQNLTMRFLLLLSTAVILTALSCKKDDCTEWQTVDVTGNYTNTPDPTGGFHNVALPDGSTVPVPKKYKVGGSDNVLGAVDAAKSILEVQTVVFNLKNGAFDMSIHITLYASTGDQIHLEGTAQVYADNTGLSWFHYADGTGKFDGISGWLNSSTTTNPTTGVNTVVGTGEVTYKN